MLSHICSIGCQQMTGLSPLNLCCPFLPYILFLSYLIFNLTLCHIPVRHYIYTSPPYLIVSQSIHVIYTFAIALLFLRLYSANFIFIMPYLNIFSHTSVLHHDWPEMTSFLCITYLLFVNLYPKKPFML